MDEGKEARRRVYCTEIDKGMHSRALVGANRGFLYLLTNRDERYSNRFALNIRMWEDNKRRDEGTKMIACRAYFYDHRLDSRVREGKRMTGYDPRRVKHQDVLNFRRKVTSSRSVGDARFAGAHDLVPQRFLLKLGLAPLEVDGLRRIRRRHG